MNRRKVTGPNGEKTRIQFSNMRGAVGKRVALIQYLYHVLPKEQRPHILVLIDTKLKGRSPPNIPGYDIAVKPKRTPTGARGLLIYKQSTFVAAHNNLNDRIHKEDRTPDITWVEIPDRDEPVAVGFYYSPSEPDSKNCDQFYNKLNKQTETLSKTHRIVLAGDANAHVPRKMGRTDIPTSPNGTRLTSLATDRELTFITGSQICKGQWTYNNGAAKSTIDHVLADTRGPPLVNALDITTTTLGSDHYVQHIQLNTRGENQTTEKRSNKARPYPRWDGTHWDQVITEYQRQIKQMDETGWPSQPSQEMETWQNILIAAIDKHSDKKTTSAHHQIKTPPKDNTVCAALRLNSQAHLNHQATPQENTKAADKALRDALHKEYVTRIAFNTNKLTDCYMEDKQLFWKKVDGIIRTARKPLPTTIITRADQVISDQASRMRAWTQHTADTSTPEPHQAANFDQKHTAQTETWLRDRTNNTSKSSEEDKIDHQNTSPITQDRILSILKKMNTGNPGPMGISKTHLKKILPVAIDRFTAIFNRIWNKADIPQSWKNTFTIYMHKKDDRTHLSNYRPISPPNTIAKIYDKILDQEIRQRLEKTQTLAPEQAGFRKNRTTLGSAFSATTFVQQRLANGNPTYIILLDITSAFDRMWRAGAFHQLHEGGVRGKLWDNLRDMYTDRTTRLHLDGMLSGPITHENGVIQGGITSPIIFLTFVNSLIAELQKAGIGSEILPKRRTPAHMFADDIAALPRSIAETHKALAAITKWANKWRITFNPKKCSVLPVTHTQEQRDIAHAQTWRLQTGKIATKDKPERYLGIMIDGTGKASIAHVKKRMRLATNKVRKMVESGIRAWQAQTKVLDLLHKTIIETSAAYGLALVPNTDKMITAVESAYGKVAKYILGTTKHSSTKAALAILGWLPIRYIMAIERIRLYAAITSGKEGPIAQILLHKEETLTKCGTDTINTEFFTTYLQRDCTWLGLGNYKNLSITKPKALTRWLKVKCHWHADRAWENWDGKTAPYVKAAAPSRASARQLIDPDDPPAIAAQHIRLLLSLPQFKTDRCDICAQTIPTHTTWVEHITLRCPTLHATRKQAQAAFAATHGRTCVADPERWTRALLTPQSEHTMPPTNKTAAEKTKQTQKHFMLALSTLME
jgi:hypothetical protein